MKECGICYETKLEKFFPCGHSACHECFESIQGHTCPYCREPFRSPPDTFETQQQLEDDIEFWLDYDRREWTVYSRVNRFGTERIMVYRNGEIPITWRNSGTLVKPTRRTRNRLRRARRVRR